MFSNWFKKVTVQGVVTGAAGAIVLAHLLYRRR